MTNLCGFRAPDPSLEQAAPALQRLAGSQQWDWKEHYAHFMHPAKLEHAESIGCFQLPSARQNGQLLDVFFAHVHPLVPVIDRKDFLARFYSLGEPPSLLLIKAVYLAAARYCVIDPST